MGIAEQFLAGLEGDPAGIAAVVIDEDRLAGAVRIAAIADIGQCRERMEIGSVGAQRRGCAVHIPDNVGNRQAHQPARSGDVGQALRVGDRVGEAGGLADVETGVRREGDGLRHIVDDRRSVHLRGDPADRQAGMAAIRIDIVAEQLREGIDDRGVAGDVEGFVAGDRSDPHRIDGRTEKGIADIETGQCSGSNVGYFDCREKSLAWVDLAIDIGVKDTGQTRGASDRHINHGLKPLPATPAKPPRPAARKLYGTIH